MANQRKQGDYVAELVESIIRVGDSSSDDVVWLDRKAIGVHSVRKYHPPPGYPLKAGALRTLVLLGFINQASVPGYSISKEQLERLKQHYRNGIHKS
jgi:hypothetical protein